MPSERTTAGPRRDRHARGIRGPLGPPVLPIVRSRSERFDALVVAAVDILEQSVPELADVDVVVEDIPPGPSRKGRFDPIDLGHCRGPEGEFPARITVYRRPIEMRSAAGVARERLVRESLVELVAELLGRSPAEVDAQYSR